MLCLDFKLILIVGLFKIRIWGWFSKFINILILCLFLLDNVDILVDVLLKFNCCKYLLIVVLLIGFL